MKTRKVILIFCMLFCLAATAFADYDAGVPLLFEAARQGYYSAFYQLRLLMSPNRELPPGKEHLDGLWLASDDGNFTQIYKGGGIGVPSAYAEASTSAGGCRVAFWTRPVKSQPRVFKVFDVCSGAAALSSTK